MAGLKLNNCEKGADNIQIRWRILYEMIQKISDRFNPYEERVRKNIIKRDLMLTKKQSSFCVL
jgi:hypothetical protein